MIDDSGVAGGSVKPEIDEQAAQVGSLPNRFKARVRRSRGSASSEALQDAWKRIAGAVYAKISPGTTFESAPIWKRQISGAWDCTWVIGGEDNLIELRKTCAPATNQKGRKVHCLRPGISGTGTRRPEPRRHAQVVDATSAGMSP